MNAFDNGDVRATVLVVRMREGKPGGGKGPLISENRSLTLATANDQTLFVFHPHRSDGVRIQNETVNTLTAFMGTGGNNMPMVAHPIQGNMVGRSDTAGPAGKGYGDDGEPMFSLTSTDRHAVAAVPIHDKATRSTGKRKLHNGEYANDGAGNGLGIGKEGDPMNTLTGGDRHAIAFSHTQGLDPQPSEEASPTLRANGSGMASMVNAQVRRLTPVECERLQGFPDDWTAGQSDTHRYKQMGNAVAVPVVEWILTEMVNQLSVE